jgi:dUTP pyrophosphatase
VTTPSQTRREYLAQLLGNGEPVDEAGVLWLPAMRTLSVMLLPTYAGPENQLPLQPAKPGDAGVDLYAVEDVVLPPSTRRAVGTGICLAVPPGYEAQIRSRSGNAANFGLMVLNSPGTIDAGYRGEIKVLLFNSNPAITQASLSALCAVQNDEGSAADLAEALDLDYHKGTITIKRGERIAQMVLAGFERPTIEVVTELPESERGAAGIGSTGR